MNTESYTPGHSPTSMAFMSRRSLLTHGQFFREHLRAGSTVLDCACGPGTITLDIAQTVTPGQVTGVDFNESQITEAKRNAAMRGIDNLSFVVANCYELPFADQSFDCVFSHALLEHLAEPGRALLEFRRVLKSGGLLGVCSPDLGGLLLAPESRALKAALDAYKAAQKSNGGDLEIGRSFGALLMAAGFKNVQMSARYECPPLPIMSEYLGVQLEKAGQSLHAQALREWSEASGGAGLFAAPWVSAVGEK